MKKSSLGRRSSTAQPQRMMLSDFESTRRERISSIPVRSRASSADRNTSMLSTSNLIRSKSSINLKPEGSSVSSYDRRLTDGVERPSRAMTMSASSGRASSYGGTKSKRDNRPLQDKEWQSMALKKVEEVIRSIPEGRGLFKTTIKPISIKLFVDISHLLLTKLDKNIVLNNANYVNEIPILAKALSYPGKVDKSWLISPNTPHSFGHVLGFLYFLSCCYEAQIKVDPVSLMYPVNFCGSSQDSWNFKTMLPYFNESYRLYCSDVPDYIEKQKELDKQILQLHFGDKTQLSRQLKVLETETRKQEENLLKERSETEALTKEVEELEALYDRRAHDFDKKSDLVSHLKEDIKRIEKEAMDLDKNQEYLNSAIEEKNNVLRNLKKSIEDQSVSLADIKQMREKSVAIQREIESEKQYLDEYEKKIFEEDLQVANLQKELQTSVRKYHFMMEEILDESILERAKIPGNVQDLDICHIVKAREVLKEVMSKCNFETTDVSMQENKNTIGELSGAIAKLESECENLEEKYYSAKEEINAVLNQHRKAVIELKKELAAIEDNRTQLKKNMPEENYEELAKRQSIIAKEMEAEVKEYGRRTKLIITERIKAFEEYKKEVYETIRRRGYGSALENIQKLPGAKKY